MVRHIVDVERCQGCGKCVEICGLELWVLIEIEGGKKRAQVTEEAAEICHCCLSCQDACPEEAILVRDE